MYLAFSLAQLRCFNSVIRVLFFSVLFILSAGWWHSFILPWGQQKQPQVSQAYIILITLDGVKEKSVFLKDPLEKSWKARLPYLGLILSLTVVRGGVLWPGGESMKSPFTESSGMRRSGFPRERDAEQTSVYVHLVRIRIAYSKNLIHSASYSLTQKWDNSQGYLLQSSCFMHSHVIYSEHSVWNPLYSKKPQSPQISIPQTFFQSLSLLAGMRVLYGHICPFSSSHPATVLAGTVLDLTDIEQRWKLGLCSQRDLDLNPSSATCELYDQLKLPVHS